jgi:hypothetical protein
MEEVMYKILNTKSLSQKQRFVQAILYSTLATILMTVFYIVIHKTIFVVTLDFLYIPAGYAIAWVVMKTGRGVKLRFSILAVVLCVLMIYFGDALVMFADYRFSYTMLWMSLMAMFQYYGANLLGSLFRIIAIYLAFKESRVI